MIRFLDCSAFYPSFTADFINAWVCAVVSVAGAYFIYWLSIKRIRQDRLKYVTVLLKSFIASTKSQSTYCSDHAIAVKQNPFANFHLKFDANKDIKRLSDKMDQEGVYHAFLWKYKRSPKTYGTFKDLYAYIDFLDSLMDDLIKTNQRSMEYIWQRKKEYQIAFNKLKAHIQRLTLDGHANQNNPNLVKFAETTLQHFLNKENDGENVVVSYTEVVDPLRKYIAQNESPSPLVTDIFLVSDELTAIYQGISLQAKHNADDYDNYAKELNEKAGQLDIASKQLQEDFK